MTIKFESNTLLDAWNLRKSRLAPETVSRLEIYKRNREWANDIIRFKGQRPKLEKGDVFVVQPLECLYFYGRVLNVGISTKFRYCNEEVHNGRSYSWHDAIVICVYNCKTQSLTLDDFQEDYSKLLAVMY